MSTSQEGEIVRALKRQKQELKQKVKELSQQDPHSVAADKQLDKLERHVQELRKQYDLSVLERKAWSEKLAEELEKIRAAQNSAAILLNKPQGRQIRMLENRVEKVLKKQKEAARIQEAQKQLEEQLNNQNQNLLNQRKQLEKNISRRKKEIEEQEEKIMQFSVLKEEADQKLKALEISVGNQQERRQKKFDACLEVQNSLEEQISLRKNSKIDQNDQSEGFLDELDGDDVKLWNLLIEVGQSVGVDKAKHLLTAAQSQQKAIQQLENQELSEQQLIHQLIHQKQEREQELQEVREIVENGRGSRALVDSAESQLRRVIQKNNYFEDKFAEKQMEVAKIVQSAEDMLRILSKNLGGIEFEEVNENNVLHVLNVLESDLGQCEQ